MKKQAILCNILLLGFLLGVYEGKIALWKDNQVKPMKVFPYQVSMLPEADQRALQKGIKINKLSQLYKLIEDYLS
ncbi:MAG: hypothetical protein E7462_04505 [Ruminococcaceae bacterium]|nr:hypothetical protein [Oscillospiraceae bacterium]